MHRENDSKSNIHLELLKLYSRNVDDEDLLAIRQLIGLYFAEKASAAMDNFTDTNEISSIDLANWAYQHWRSKTHS